MGSSVGTFAGTAAAVISAAILATPAQARPVGPQVVQVPCAASALATAVNAANAVPATLRLSPGCIYQITATLTISGQVGLVGGPSTTIRPAPGFSGRLLDVTSSGALNATGIFVVSASGNSGDEGVGVRNAGRLNLRYVTISGNTANDGNGGGMSNLATGQALISHSVISGNNATGTSGAGTGAGGGILNRGTLTVVATRLSANTVGDGGAAIDTVLTGTTHVIQSTLDNNVAGGDAGGIFNSGITSVDRTLIVHNSAGGSGGGIFQNSGAITVTRSVIKTNTPDNCAPANSVPGCVG